jgi:protein TonB
LAIGLYGGALIALFIFPYFMPELMKPPEAGLSEPKPPDRIVLHTRGRREGDNLPAAPVRKGVRDGRENGPDRRRDRAPRPSASVSPLAAPLSPADTAPEASSNPNAPGDARRGDPSGTENGVDRGVPGTECPGCIGTGVPGPEVPDGPFGPSTPGLIPPRIIASSRALPQYPAPARRVGLQGTVILLVVIEADGRVGEIQVLRSPDQRWGFDLAAIGAVKEWRYEPALMNDRPVAAYITVMVEFTLSR